MYLELIIKLVFLAFFLEGGEWCRSCYRDIYVEKDKI